MSTLQNLTQPTPWLSLAQSSSRRRSLVREPSSNPPGLWLRRSTSLSFRRLSPASPVPVCFLTRNKKGHSALAKWPGPTHAFCAPLVEFLDCARHEDRLPADRVLQDKTDHPNRNRVRAS